MPQSLDNTQKTVHGAQTNWQSANPGVATVAATGEVTAVSQGGTVVTLTIGSRSARVAVLVNPGARPKQTDAEWDAEHAHDCDNPISYNRVNDDQNRGTIAASHHLANVDNWLQSAVDEDLKEGQIITPQALPDEKAIQKNLARDAAYHLEKPLTKAVKINSVKRPSVASATTTAASRAMYFSVDPNDGSSGDYTSSHVTDIYNDIGSPHYRPQEAGGESGIRMKRNLGSYNYSFSAPVLSLGGRGIGVNLAMTYNSRLWNREDAGMQFNFNRGWPAAGWTFGYGRLIPDYDAVGSGNFLLIQPDGTRIALTKVTSTQFCKSTDGSNIQLNTSTNNILYPDGTQVKYIWWENRLLPNIIKTRNGDLLSISYRPRTSTFRFRWAIDTIQDTLGRNIVFHYYGDSGYATGTNRPVAALATITTPDQGSGQEREVIRLEYQDIPISYDFSNPPDPNSVPTTLTAVQKIYYPATGRGFLFEDFSSYGMARKISSRIGMLDSGGTIQTGTEVAYTKYNYQTNVLGDPNYQNGPLADSPKFTERSEYWQGKTDAQGNATTQETIYRYQRMPGMFADTVYYPDSANDVNNPIMKMVTTTYPGGSVGIVEIKDKNDNVLQKTETFYTNPGDGSLQIGEVKVTNEANETSRTVFTYYTSYARLKWVDEYGFSATTIQRRTEYEYLDGQAYIDARLINLVNKVRVYNGSSLSQPVALTVMFYDDYAGYPRAGASGMQSYTWIPPTHNPNFDQTYTTRGNVTMTRTYTDVSAAVYQDKWTKYDIFGNVVEAQVSCCNYKQAAFAGSVSNNYSHWYSQPDSTTDGIAGTAPYLTTSYQYDFYTGLLTSQTASNNVSVNYTYDAAWRPLTVNLPSTGVTTTTSFDKDANQKDTLSYTEQVSYTDVTAKTITTRSWFDGAGHVLKAGTGAGSSPTTFDMSSAVYDHLGRVARQSNPFQGNSSGSGSSSFYTVNVYDNQSRAIEVDLPDDNPQGQRSRVLTTYNGSQMTVTDQVGRQRKSQSDGLGRLTSVTEPDPATGTLSLITNYAYDTLNNLTQVNQGGQLREYKYDSLSRLLYERTPEQNKTINDGAGGLWSAKFTYTDFNAVDTHTDARGVVSTNGYDTLNRLQSVSYTIPNGASVEATANVALSYQATGGGIGEVASINNGSASEAFSYDSLGRLQSVARLFAGNTTTYTTSYEYNAISQLKSITYPSLKKVQATYDSRGRLNQLDKYNGSTFQSTYLSAMSYNTAGQVTGYSLGNTVNEAFSYSSDRLQLTSQTTSKSGTPLMSLSYGYQASAGQSGANTTAGNSGQLMNVTATINGQGRNQSFTYDNLGRLATAAGWNTTTNRRFTYDRYGNRTGMWDATSGGNQIQSVVLQQAGGVPTNRLTSVTTNSVQANYQYDSNGNVTNDGQHSYSYDTENRLVKVDSGAAVYEYDSSNRRVKKTVGASVTYYIWEGGSVIAEYDNGQAQGAGGVKYYHADRLSTRMITSSSGVVLGTQDHLPFGEDAQSGSGENEKHRFTNYERDSESGTDYAVNRQYSNGTGRFLRPDPMQGSLGNPQTFNRYAYVANDPINLIDPLGLNIEAPQKKRTCEPSAANPGCTVCWDGDGVVRTYCDPSPFIFWPTVPPPPNINPWPRDIGGTTPEFPNKITDCLGKLFNEFFSDKSTFPNFVKTMEMSQPIDFSKINLHYSFTVGAEATFTSDSIAVTPNKNNIYFRNKKYFTIDNLAHELVHIEQHLRYEGAYLGASGLGQLGFYNDYLTQAILAGAKHDDLPLEAEAIKKEKAIVSALKAKNISNPCGLPFGSVR